tara:strand:- start:20883 stop:21569 length:687 start_codon:yes stop_codon:yes gene_type:complete
MHFLAQIEHSAPMLDLGEGKVLHAFKCNFDSVCSFWDTDSGANAVFLLDKSELGSGLTPYPAHRVEPAKIYGQSTAFLELRLIGWDAFDDQLTKDQKPYFYDYDAFWELDDNTAHPSDFDVMKDNKAGPIPYWTGNGPSERLKKVEIFLQITGDAMPVQDIPPSVAAMQSAPGVSWIWEGKTMTPMFSDTEADGTSTVYWANFCSDGIGYFFYEENPGGRRYGLEILR